jgi:transcriptional regulator with XRE-family HTH domain
MAKKPPSDLQTAVSRRLAAVQRELELSDDAIATRVGTNRTTWSNWINEQNMPEEAAMLKLCDIASLTLDWIYRGDLRLLPVDRAIRLEARLRGLDPDAATVEVLRESASVQDMVPVVKERKRRVAA